MNELSYKDQTLKMFLNSGVLNPFFDKGREINNDLALSKKEKEEMFVGLNEIYYDFLAENNAMCLQDQFNLRSLK